MTQRKQRGMALIIVLLIMSSMVAVVSLTQEYGVQALRRAKTVQVNEETKWALLGAESLLVNQYGIFLSASVRRPELPWMNRTFPLQIDGREYKFRIRDLQTCFNINTLFSGEKRNLKQAEPKADKTGKAGKAGDKAVGPQEILASILVQTGSDPSQAEHIVQQLLYQGRQNGYLFADVTELRRQPSITREQMKKLKSQVCALPTDTLALNINGLEAEHAPLLSALLGTFVTVDAMQSFLLRRPELGWEKLADITDNGLPEALKQAFSSKKSYFSTGSNFYEIQVGSVDGGPFLLRTQIARSVEGFAVLNRSYGSATD